MHNPDKSEGELRSFVEKHRLRDRNSNVQFLAMVSITTESTEIEDIELEVHISFQVYNKLGRVYLINLDPHVYPVELYADYQEMKHIEGKYLMISGHHKQNSTIGGYSIEIVPLRKLRE